MSEMSHITQNYYFYEGSQKVDHIDKQEFTYNIYRSAPVMDEMEGEDLPMVCEPLVDALAPIFYEKVFDRSYKYLIVFDHSRSQKFTSAVFFLCLSLQRQSEERQTILAPWARDVNDL